VSLLISTKKFHFFIDRKKTKYLAKGISGHFFMNIKLEHAFIIDKKKSAHLLEP
jgi:hypothetical protein